MRVVAIEMPHLLVYLFVYLHRFNISSWCVNVFIVLHLGHLISNGIALRVSSLVRQTPSSTWKSYAPNLNNNLAHLSFLHRYSLLQAFILIPYKYIVHNAIELFDTLLTELIFEIVYLTAPLAFFLTCTLWAICIHIVLHPCFQYTIRNNHNPSCICCHMNIYSL